MNWTKNKHNVYTSKDGSLKIVKLATKWGIWNCETEQYIALTKTLKEAKNINYKN